MLGELFLAVVMSLTPCPECKNSISSAARDCPHCGYPLKRSGLATMFFPRQASQGHTLVAWITTGTAVLYLVVFMAGLINNRRAAGWEVIIFLPALAIVLAAAWIFRSYATVGVASLLTVFTFFTMILIILGPYLFGEYAASEDGAGIGLGLSIVFAQQWLLLAVTFVLTAVAAFIERIWFMKPNRAATLPEKISVSPPASMPDP